MTISFLAVLPFGCIEPCRDRPTKSGTASEIEMAEERKPYGTRLRGHVVLGHEVRSFRPCGVDSELWLIPIPELRTAYDTLSPGLYGKVFVELLCELSPPPETGFGAEYDGQLKVLEVMRTAPATEGHGCAEDLTDIAFRAAGNEPFWNLRVTPKSITFSTPAVSELVFPGPTPVRTGRGWSYETKSEGPDPRSIRFSVEEGSCTDGMVGAQYSWRARVEIERNLYEGCAWAGDIVPLR